MPAKPRTEKQRKKHRDYMRNYYRVEDPVKRTQRLAAMRIRFANIRPERSLYERCRAHGIAVAQFTALVDEQNWRCAACKRIPEPTRRSGTGFHIDHDHKCCPGHFSCGKCVRGLLCASCNMGLGNFSDNRDFLILALEYLEKWPELTVTATRQ